MGEVVARVPVGALKEDPRSAELNTWVTAMAMRVRGILRRVLVGRARREVEDGERGR